MGRKGILFRACLWLSATANLSIVAVAPVHAQSIGARAVDVPSQPLAATLTQIGRQTDSEVVFSSADVRGKNAPAVHGSLTAEEALHVALQGSSLNAQRTAQGAYLIKADASAPGRAGRATEATEEIIVTAQKREERLIETPISVSVLSAKNLGKMAATQFRDFANTVPGLTFTSVGAGFTQVSLRGVTSGIDVGPTVGIYVDEVPYGSSSAFPFGANLALDVGLFDLDRIEVLRGPQGTLYGASTMGGLLKYVTKRPDTKSFGVDVQTSVSGTRSGGVNYDFSTAINIPFSSRAAALRVGGFFSRDGGYIDNQTLGEKDVNRSSIYGGRADLLLMPTDNLTVRINAFLQNIDREGQASADYDRAGNPQGGTLDQFRPFAEPFDQRFRLYSGTVVYDFGGAALTSISSYQTLGVSQQSDLGTLLPVAFSPFGGPYSAVGFLQNVTSEKFAQELRLASTGSHSLEWILGGFYTDDKAHDREAFALHDLAGTLVPNILSATKAETTLEEVAVFGDLTYHFTPKFDVTGGVRWATNQQTRAQAATGLFGISSPVQHSRDGVATYLANARYHFSDHGTAYLRYSTGYRPGGPNLEMISPITLAPIGSKSFGPDRLKSYEAGIKVETPDRRFSVDLAGYYNDWTNIQILVISSALPFFTNAAGGASVGGAEVTLSAQPIRELELTGAFAYQDAQIAKDDADLGAKAGDPLPNVPRYTATATVDYTFVDLETRPTFGGTVRYVSGREASFDGSVESPQYHLPAYTVVDLRVGLSIGAVDARFFIRNLLDERAQFSAYTTRGRPQPAISQPRTIGISATAHF